MSPESQIRTSGTRPSPIADFEAGAEQPDTPSGTAGSDDGASRAALVHALEVGEFMAHLQPQVNLRTGHVVAVEALARWTRPGHGICPPAAFLPAIERFGLMPVLTDVILDHALRWSAERSRDGAEPLGVSVNVSGPTLDASFVSRVDLALERWQVPPHRLTVEITETGIMENSSDAVEVLGCLKSLGVQLSIDDFGTGYSSLARLHRLPIDEIKIDREFVRELREGADHGMVRTIADLGRNLRLRVIAEGVEHEPELAQLAAMGCDLAQGFLISEPLEPAAFEAWLKRYLPTVNVSPNLLVGGFGVLGPSIAPKAETLGLGERLQLVAHGITMSGSLETTLQRLLGEMSDALGASFAVCWINDPEAQQLEPLALWSAPADSRLDTLATASREVRYPAGRGLPGIAFATDTTVRSADLDREPHFLLTAAARHADCSTALCCPLRSNNQPIGVLEFFAARPFAASSATDSALRDIGSLIGEFVSARRAEQETASLTRILASLTGAIMQLSAAKPFDFGSQLCLNSQELANAQAVLLWQPMCDERALTVTASCGVPINPIKVSLTDGHSGAAAAFHARHPIFISDVAHHALPSKRLAIAAQAASALYQPICLGESSIGVLAIAWKQQQARLPPSVQSAIDALARSAAPLLPPAPPGPR